MPSLWIFLAGLGAALTISLPYFRRRWLEEDYYGPKDWFGLMISLVLIGGSVVLMVVATIKAFTPDLAGLWWSSAIVFFITLLVYGGAALSDAAADYHAAAVVVVGLALLVGLITSVIKAMDDNSYRVNHGEVVGHRYSPASDDADEDWMLVIRDCTTYGYCVDGVLHFGSSSVFAIYPLHSTYPWGP